MENKNILNYPQEAIKIARKFIKDYNKEHLIGIYLNSRYIPIFSEIISIGTVDSHIVHPREIFKPAILKSASYIIILHNHPSNNATPTDEDIKVTNKLKEVGKILGINLLDHIIFSNDKKEYCSFKESKQL